MKKQRPMNTIELDGKNANIDDDVLEEDEVRLNFRMPPTPAQVGAKLPQPSSISSISLRSTKQ